MNLNISEYRNIKNFIILSVDIISCILSIWLAFSLRLEVIYVPTSNFYFHSFISIIVFTSVFFFRKNYDVIFRTQGINDLKNIFLSWLISLSIIFALLKILNFQPDLRYFESTSSSIIIIQGFIFGFMLLTSRAILVFFLIYFLKKKQYENVAIYGAGSAGQQFLQSLNLSDNFRIVYFLDDNKRLINNSINSIKIIDFEKFKKVFKHENIKKIFITIPSLKNEQKNKLLNKLEDLDLEIKILPSLNELANTRIDYSNLKNIEIKDILNRDINFNHEQVSKYFVNKNILITGAGGSIGKEITKQISKLEIKRLIILDNSELNLFEIEKEVSLIKNKNFELVTKLIDITNKNKLDKMFNKYNIDILFHAAAYKHVDLLERNPIEAYKNNLLGTSYLVKLSEKYNLDKMILISTDKAVYPLNVMGFTKRFSELFLQSYSVEKNCRTVFSSVRFGNVLGSSGSVIPIFQNQIRKGGPVTVTDKKVTRFFMTIPEAVKLILESSCLAKNNEIYYLDMGKSHNIYELAKKMIRLNGLKLKTKDEKGDIEIIFTGLKKGEKIYEELSYSKPENFSINKNILIDSYNFGNSKEILNNLEKLINYIENENYEEILEFSKKIKTH